MSDEKHTEAISSGELKCPACGVQVLPEQPACTECGERLFVEHPGALPRDADAVKKDAFESDPSAE